jgi:hypothetical protein
LRAIDIHVAVFDQDRFTGQPDEALHVGLAELLRVGVGAAEDDHFPAPRSAQVVDVLIDEQSVAAEVAGVDE